MVYGIERFRVVDGHSGRTGGGFVLIETYGDGGRKGKEGGSRGVFGFETVLRAVSG